ncbi:MAG: tRNA lysidine(34) synthetase TilS [Flavobacteriaceae bacterium]
MLKNFGEHIQRQFPELVKSPFLLACSGGIDSMVLAHLCHILQLRFSLAHCNFGLRGAESDGDADFVEKFGEAIDKKVFIKPFNTSEYVSQHKVSVQMAARTLRYEWFGELMRKKDIPFLVTAHHADDSLETFLINLSRGTGLEGLVGIPERNGHTRRPLLPFSRAEIENYAQQNNLMWREDSSNQETQYLRNRIRHHIVPELKELHPTFLDNFMHTLQFLQESQQLNKAYAHSLREGLLVKKEGHWEISVEKLKMLRPLKPHLYLLFGAYGFSEWNNVVHLVSATNGKEVRSHSHRLIKYRENLILAPLEKKGLSEYIIPKGVGEITEPVHLKLHSVEQIVPHTNHTIYVDADSMVPPLRIGKWKAGDIFYPAGMKGKKKLSKFLRDEKMDKVAREGQWLLFSGNDVVWVIGLRADARFQVTKQTTKILKIVLCDS